MFYRETDSTNSPTYIFTGLINLTYMTLPLHSHTFFLNQTLRCLFSHFSFLCPPTISSSHSVSLGVIQSKLIQTEFAAKSSARPSAGPRSSTISDSDRLNPGNNNTLRSVITRQSAQHLIWLPRKLYHQSRAVGHDVSKKCNMNTSLKKQVRLLFKARKTLVAATFLPVFD